KILYKYQKRVTFLLPKLCAIIDLGRFYTALFNCLNVSVCLGILTKFDIMSPLLLLAEYSAA
ncbi:hypothetical protein, partial [Helicobacter cinaedi]|uniref:hypothetical protein n=1 Tax=Helicobacter cinaedi TaxID=213 RepID=UPI001A9EE301